MHCDLIYIRDIVSNVLNGFICKAHVCAYSNGPLLLGTATMIKTNGVATSTATFRLYLPLATSPTPFLLASVISKRGGFEFEQQV